jgi:hypothetical protein
MGTERSSQRAYNSSQEEWPKNTIEGKREKGHFGKIDIMRLPSKQVSISSVASFTLISTWSGTVWFNTPLIGHMEVILRYKIHLPDIH